MPDGPASWTASELALFTSEGSLTLHAGDDSPGHGESVELGMVVVNDRLFVRAYRGTGSRWYQAALAARRGWICADSPLQCAAGHSSVDAPDTRAGQPPRASRTPLTPPIRRFAELPNNSVHWTESGRGGHFAAMEEPACLPPMCANPSGSCADVSAGPA